MDIDHSFIKHWKETGDKETDDVHRFVCYFIIFNYLYEAHCYQNHINCGRCKRNGYKCESCSERIRIRKMLKDCRTILGENFINALNLSGDSELIIKEVQEVRNGELIDNKYDNTIDIENIGDFQEIDKLFMNIYQVRCNLFHGKKSMMMERDKGLVRESADVLQHFLNAYINQMPKK